MIKNLDKYVLRTSILFCQKLYVMVFLGNNNFFAQREIRQIPEGEYQKVKTLESNFILNFRSPNVSSGYRR